MTNLLRSILSAYKRTTGVIYFIYGVTVLIYLSLRYGENMANGEGAKYEAKQIELQRNDETVLTVSAGDKDE